MAVVLIGSSLVLTRLSAAWEQVSEDISSCQDDIYTSAQFRMNRMSGRREGRGSRGEIDGFRS